LKGKIKKGRVSADESEVPAYFYTSLDTRACKKSNVKNLKEIHSATVAQG
jgi:hypothetical protein